MEVFGVSNYMARQAKKLVQEKGILSTPNPKCGKMLPKDTLNLVESFYTSDDVSRVMPGKKDVASIMTTAGQREHCQKRLLLCNLKEAYAQFKMHHPGVEVGFSKFADLRPKQCVLAGASGTHSVCVCTLHQNTKLMMAGSRLETLTSGELKHYRHCLAAIQCNPPRVQCFLRDCTECPGTEALGKKLQELMDDRMVDTVEFKEWTSTDRAALETRVLATDEFLEHFLYTLNKLRTHDFIAKMQAQFLRDTKDKLQQREILAITDFSENYSVVVQDEIQSFHWTNSQATVHPFACYYHDGNQLHHFCFLVISECLVHDTVAVHLFQQKLIHFVASLHGEKPKKIIYISDGCAAQYKNRKNFLNLCYHFQDFDVEAEWHFFATSHGKSAGDGAGGTLKRLATKASLQRPYNNQILTPQDLYQFAVSNIKGMHFAFATQMEHEQEEKSLAPRFELSRTIPGTHDIHCVKPLSLQLVEVKQFSTSSDSRTERTTISATAVTLPFSVIQGYVAVSYSGHCWLGYVLEANQAGQTITVTFLHPCIPSPSFVYPQAPDILQVDPSDILCILKPVTATGRTYTLTKKEMLECTRLLESQFKC